MTSSSNTTGTISGDLEKARREMAGEVTLRLKRLGPISLSVFKLGRLVLGALPLGLIYALGAVIWDYLRLPISPEWLEITCRIMVIIVTTGGVAVATEAAFDHMIDRWVALWLPPRH